MQTRAAMRCTPRALAGAILLIGATSVSPVAADSRLFIHNNTDTPLKLDLLPTQNQPGQGHYKLQPSEVRPYQHLSVLKFDRRRGLDRNRDYFYRLRITPEHPRDIGSSKPLIVAIKLRRGRTTKRMWHWVASGRQRHRWHTDKKWRTTHWGKVKIRYRERLGTPDADLEIHLTAPDRKLFRLPVESRKLLGAPGPGDLFYTGPFYYDVKETNGDNKHHGEREKGGVKDAHCKGHDGQRAPFCYGGHEGTDFMLEGGFKRMKRKKNFVVAARSGIVTDVVDCYYDRCRLPPGKTKPSCFGHNVSKFGDDMQSNYIIIEHEGEIQTKYVHIKRGSARVAIGQYVNCGGAIAEIGSAGKSAKPHLHFSVKTHRKHSVDPFKGKFTGRTFWYKNGHHKYPAAVCAPNQPSHDLLKRTVNATTGKAKSCPCKDGCR